MFLALDTSGAVSAAVGTPDQLHAATATYDPRRHAELLTPMLHTVLTDAACTTDQLTGIIAGVGPGPFTGLRVAIVTATVCGHVWDVPVHGVCSLDAVAATAYVAKIPGDRPLVVATDARRKEVYWATYTAAGTRTTNPAVGKADTLHLPDDALIVGRGAQLFAEEFTAMGRGITVLADDTLHDATAAGLIAAYGHGATAELTPMYLRKPDAQEPTPKPRVTP